MSGINKIVYFALTILILLSFRTNFFEEILAAAILFAIIFHLFWAEKTSLVLLFGLLFQWLSISIGYIYILFSGEEHKNLLRRPYFALENINTAYWLSILGLLVFTIGLKLALYNSRPLKITKDLIAKYNVLKVIVVYIIFSIGSDILFHSIRFTVPGLSEPVSILGYFKWSLFFIMIYLSFVRNEYKIIVYIIMLIEILIGFSGFFSEFKNIFILFPIAYLSFNSLKIKQSILLTLLVFIIFNIGVAWTYVKVEQRNYLSGGSKSQVVKVSKIDALKNLYKLTGKLNKEKYYIGLTAMVQRLYSIEYFSATIKNIPEKKAFFKGEILQDAINHLLMPRILFPDKKIVDDSKQTSKLTGIYLESANKGVSISVGYMAESYADFGAFFMFVEIFIIGFVIGYIYKLLINGALNSFWSMAITFPMFFLVNINGINLIKVTGRLFMFLIVFFLINKFIISLLDQILQNPNPTSKT